MWQQSQTSGKSLSATWLQYTFTSSNLTCYHAEFVNSGQFSLPPLCKLPELPCKIPGVCTNSWRAPGRHRKAHGVEVRNYSSHHRGMFVLQTAVLVEESCLSPSPLWLLSPQLLTLTQAQGTRSMRCTDKESLQGLPDKNSAWCY